MPRPLDEGEAFAVARQAFAFCASTTAAEALVSLGRDVRTVAREPRE